MASTKRAFFSSPVKSVSIIHKADHPEARAFAAKTEKWLKSQKVSVTEVAKSELVLALGGDGTYLHAVRQIAGRPIPILGANFGQIGFLTETEAKELFDKLKSVLAGKVQPVRRFLLDVQVLKGKKVLHSDLSLNDVVVERGANTHLIEMEVTCEESLVSRLRGDGIIVSTAIGSTAYNLSAGGPIVHPEVSALAVTPVCPHSLTARPIVVADHHKITIRLLRKQKATLMIDGAFASELEMGMDVVIQKSKHVHYLIPSNVDYFELLNRKLEFGHRS